MSMFSSSQPKFLTWEVKCLDGKHSITIETGVNGAFPLKLYIDSKLTETITKPQKSFFVKVEHQFYCGEDAFTLVWFMGKMDLVHRGMLLNSKIQYEPNNAMPKAYCVLLVLLNFLSLISFIASNMSSSGVLFYFMLAIAMAAACSIHCLRAAMSPFCPKKKQLLMSLLICLGAIAFIVLLSQMDFVVKVLLS